MLKRALVTFLFLFMPLYAVVLPAAPVAAAEESYCGESSPTFLAFPTWYKYLKPDFVTPAGSYMPECKIVFEFPDDIGKVLLAVVEIMLRIVGILAVGYVIYGGVKYIMSQGEPDKTKSAKNTIVNALVGMAIAVIATAIVNVVARTLIQ